MDRRGDLSNDDVPRWIITLDALTSDYLVPEKTMFRSWNKVAQETRLDRLVSGRMYQARDRHPIVYEAAVFGLPRAYATALLERLESESWLVRYINTYEDRRELASALPFRPDVKAVIDTPAGVLLWGARGITINEISN